MEAATENADPGVVGIELHENCTSRCWTARREPCRCACGGRNHGAMQPGSGKLVSPGGCAQVQTVMAIPDGTISDRTISDETTPDETISDGMPDEGATRDGRAGEPDHRMVGDQEPAPESSPWRPGAEEVLRAIARRRAEQPYGTLPETERLEAVRAYLAEEYAAPAGLQERIDREAERCAAEIMAREAAAC